MLRISKLTDYAMLVLAQMAKQPEMLLSASVLADVLHLSLPTVSKVLKMLAEAGLVHSVRGVEGGYRLKRSAQEITVAAVIRAIEGPFSMTECGEKNSCCMIETTCGMKGNWLKINKIVYSLLEKITILDMASPLSLE